MEVIDTAAHSFVKGRESQWSTILCYGKGGAIPYYGSRISAEICSPSCSRAAPRSSKRNNSRRRHPRD